MLSFFPVDVLDCILDLIESASEGFPTYSFKNATKIIHQTPSLINIDGRYIETITSSFRQCHVELRNTCPIHVYDIYFN